MLTTRQAIGALLVICCFAGSADGAEPRLLSDAARVGDADRALVLIHGLLGSPVDSFGNWPTLIASDNNALPGHGKVSDIAVYAVDYEADFRTKTKLDDVAVGVARDLAASQIFRRHRHIWLVAHSMGGLVLKRTIALWKLEGNSGLLERILGVGMLGVPSAGAPLADLANSYGVGEIASTFGWNGELLKDLATDGGSYLDSLETNWLVINTARNAAPARRFTPIVSCGFETKPEVDRDLWSSIGLFITGKYFRMKDIDTIVPKLFTSSACDDRRAFSAKHTALIKPKGLDDSIHIWLRSLIERSISEGQREQRVAVTTAAPDSVKDPLNFNLADRIAFLNQQRDPANPEVFEFADPASRRLAGKLVLRGRTSYGLTNADVWERMGAQNACLHVAPSPNRMKITLSIRDELIECKAGAAVCVGQTCD